VQRRRQRRGPHHAGAPTWFDEGHFVEPADFIFHADAPVELDQICTHAKKYVLAVVDHFAGAGMLVGRSPSAEVRTALEYGHAKARLGQRAGCSQSGQASAGYGYGGSEGCGI